MNVQIRKSRVLSVAVLSVTVLAASAVESRAACMVPGGSKASLTGAAKLVRPGAAPTLAAAATLARPGTAPTLPAAATLARPGTAPALAAAAQGNGSNGGGSIVGLWQNVMTAFPGTSDEFVFDFGFQQFHADGTELMISGGVPPTIGNVCIGTWERGSGGVIRLVHVTWNWAGDEIIGDPPTGYFWLEVTLRTNERGRAYTGRFYTASFDLGTGPLGSGGPPQEGTEFEGKIEAVKISVE
jgi:hypothetical protein